MPRNTLGDWDEAAGTSAPAADQSGLPSGVERIESSKPLAPGSRRFLRVEVTDS